MMMMMIKYNELNVKICVYIFICINIVVNEWG